MTSPSPGRADRSSAGEFVGVQAPNTRRARRYGFACTSCKSRKVKCSGDQPICSRCRRTGEECVWPSQESTERRLRDAHARIRDLEASMRPGDDAQPENMNSQDGIPAARAQSSLPSGVSPISVEGTSLPTNRTSSNAGSNHASSLWFQVGIGEDGTITYNGPTSRFHAGPLKERGGGEGEAPTPTHRDTLRSQYALMSSVWMPLIAAQQYIKGTGVSTEIGLALLDIYWTWLHPLHNCVYRPVMMMDLALGGPYCSDFLLMCIFGLAARHLPEHHPDLEGIQQGDQFILKAKQLLLEEMAAPRPSIPTIQGLLILGGRQCAMGRSSEGWLYTGMAIRMMTDIGIHLDATLIAELERLTPAEIETRKRLYNSAYIWDKTLSLALGRLPSLTGKPYKTDEILDKFDDERAWQPVHAVEVSDSFIASPSMNSTTFCAFCQIHEITTDMMFLFSSGPRHQDLPAHLVDLDARFQRWLAETPASIIIDDPAVLPQSPPPHIVSLNLLYHALQILLRRPYLNSTDTHLRDQNMQICINHSRKMHAIHALYARTFPHRLMTYQVSYCIFIAATIEVQQLKLSLDQSEKAEAANRLADAIRVLRNEASHTPGIGRSMDTIRRLLSAAPNQVCNVPERAEGSSLGTATENQHRHQERAPIVRDSQLLQVGEPNERGQIFEDLGRGGITTGNAQFGQMNDMSVTSDNPMYASIDGLGVGDWVGTAWADTSAGFHPEAFSWATADMLQRRSALSSFGDYL
ncbi:fungal-specific transcription factor domain-containing protein [Thelonectria olida]|uniref:Fungal-specific transcription factor domain-containing protein n=1 Tax=Thelonectria olida TaxID=1576542 RepID=A0A9P8VVD6_9HYPO|nr:fungal-specific transcription factor domain-containing protein [Thelonectria olida]